MTATAVVLRNAPSSLDFPRASRLSRSVRAALLSLAMAANRGAHGTPSARCR
ncbi:hypothetical protein RBU13_28485 [Pseudomonas aeruginosa]|nr:hypothetical protein [Pseudomonas aeruginosa]MDQ4369996.1 hypothetical protein [Pseudomonas aeruginosa]